LNAFTIRQKYIDYFAERGHMQFPSMPLVPTDPSITTLFTIAGMQQLIPYFLGREEPPSRRIVNAQKSVRTVDIEEVGDDSHLTFLEMLGNFSIGDYFKREAIGYTWDFLTRVMQIPADRWWATIYPGDEEAREAWLDAGMASDRIGETEGNWWAQGPTGPCGPDSEIFFDRGVVYSCGRPNCRPETECCDRFLETWNNVFIVYFQEASGDRRPLPWKNIDTGMGFERLVTIAQGVESIYDTDLFRPIIGVIEQRSGVQYGRDAAVDRSFRIIADHARAIAMMICDGVMPAAESRGYVLRRLIRRAALRGRTLGIDEAFLSEPISATIDILCDYWTELTARRTHILYVVQQEEQRFLQTLSRGLALFEEIASNDSGTVDGQSAFLLYDTHGFPLELTAELASERGLDLDRDGFTAALREQQERARSGRKTSRAATTLDEYSSLAGSVEPTVFTGYEELDTSSHVVAVLVNGQPVNRASTGDDVEVILSRTPFYAESGGQIGDTGVLRSDSARVAVLDTQRPIASLIVHRGRLEEGTLVVGDAVEAEVDTERRLHILPHHSGTHLLHKALQEVLGPEATQAGSLVAPDRLRFDFRWPCPLTDDELHEVQDRVNAAIWANLPVRLDVLPYDAAIAQGAMALFGEKYGDVVRMVSMGDWSKELCGGTHVHATGDIGLLVVIGETGIGSGVRRIEALAGASAYAYVTELRQTLEAAAGVLETKPDAIVRRAEQLTAQMRDQEKHVAALSERLAAREADLLTNVVAPIGNFAVLARQIHADSVDYLQMVTDEVRNRMDRGIVVLAAAVEGKPAFCLAVTHSMRGEGFEANRLLRAAAQIAGGGAGGTADFAQGGGKDQSKVQDVLDAVVAAVTARAGQ